MANLKYVCLSDLHLGADYSLLSKVDYTENKLKVNPLQPSPTLQALGAALLKLVDDLRGSEPPTLILLGDILDLGRSKVRMVAMGFQRFVEAMFPADQPIFSISPAVLYVPGNHDHELWQATKQEIYVDQIKHSTPGDELPKMSPVTKMFNLQDLPLEEWAPKSSFLTELMRTYEHLAKASVRVAYPNFGEVSLDRGRGVVFHHGHFIEPVYHLMSDMKWVFDGKASVPKKIKDLERENATWIDFVWSAFGGTGKVGRDADTIYTLLQDTAAFNRFLSRLTGRAARRLLPNLPLGGEAQVKHYVRLIIKAILDLTVEQWADLERHSYLSPLTQSSITGLCWYLEKPLRQQIKSELKMVPDDLSFIFGHTHKPFGDALPLSKYHRPVSIFNTGGWVLDEPQMLPLEGAAAVFVDDELNVVSVRLYNDPINGDSASFLKCSGYPEKNNPLLEKMKIFLGNNDEKQLLGKLRDAANAELQQRCTWLIQQYDLDSERVVEKRQSLWGR